MEQITIACEKNDCNNLLMIIRNLDNVQMEYITYYMNALKKYPILTMKEVNEVIQRVNQNVAIATIKSRDSM